MKQKVRKKNFIIIIYKVTVTYLYDYCNFVNLYIFNLIDVSDFGT